MEQKGTGCQAPPEAPKLCANGCGFFGTAATMNLCSKCHEVFVLNQEQSQIASSSTGCIAIANANSSDIGSQPVVVVDPRANSTEFLVSSTQVSTTSAFNTDNDARVKGSPNRCNTCRKRIGLTGFSCRCGKFFCAIHRYSDKHSCSYDYQIAAQDAIAKANPVVKAEKLNKI